MEHDLQNAPDQVRSVADTFVTGAPVTSTERIVSQREVEAAGERFRSVMEAVGDMLWITSSTGVILEERSSPGNNNLKEKNFLELFHPADQERVAAIWQDAVAHGRAYELEGHLQHGGEYCLFLVRGANDPPVRTPAHAPLHPARWQRLSLDQRDEIAPENFSLSSCYFQARIFLPGSPRWSW